MKKNLLLLTFLLVAFIGRSQDCLSIRSTGFPQTGSPAASTGLNSISVPSPDVVWVAARSGTPANNRRTSVSTDGGETFTASVANLGANSANLGISNICGVSATTAYICANAPTGEQGIWKTTDSGATWTRQPSASFNTATSFPNWVYFWDENNGVCMGDPASGYFEIYTTSNGGANWTRTPSANLPAIRNDLVDDEFGLTNVFQVTGNTVWFGTSYGRLIRSTDKGLSFTAIQTPVADFGAALNAASGYSGSWSFSNDMMGSVIDSDYGYWRTSDGGVNWVQDSNGIPRNFDIAYIPGTSTVICIGEDNVDGVRGTSYSFDDGVTWTACTETLNNGAMVAPLVVYDANLFFVSGFATSTTAGGIFKYTGGQLPTKSFYNKELFNASPNPTSGNLTLTGKNISNVIVSDILGKQVLKTNYTDLDADVNINLSSFDNGVYMVKVTNTDGNSSTIKVIKQ